MRLSDALHRDALKIDHFIRCEIARVLKRREIDAIGCNVDQRREGCAWVNIVHCRESGDPRRLGAAPRGRGLEVR